MKPFLVIMLMATCVLSGLAMGLSIGTLTYGDRLRLQDAIISQMRSNEKNTKLLLDAWKKTATLAQQETLACEDELKARK